MVQAVDLTNLLVALFLLLPFTHFAGLHILYFILLFIKGA